jgi:hypothetical protein
MIHPKPKGNNPMTPPHPVGYPLRPHRALLSEPRVTFKCEPGGGRYELLLGFLLPTRLWMLFRRQTHRWAREGSRRILPGREKILV